MCGQQRPPVAAACRAGTGQQRARPAHWPLRRARRAQYDLTWFVNPNNLPYFEVVALEHGYIRGEVNATHFHIQARPRGRTAPAPGPAAVAACALLSAVSRAARRPSTPGSQQCTSPMMPSRETWTACNVVSALPVRHCGAWASTAACGPAAAHLGISA